MKSVDCSKTVNFLREKARMTKDCTVDCYSCPCFAINNGRGETCAIFPLVYPEKAIEIVQRWSDEHPLKTYKDDFLEKFPDALLNKEGYPHCCWCNVYGINNKNCYSMSCNDCWDKPMEE